MEYCRLLFDHEDLMEDYVQEEVVGAGPALKILIEERSKTLKDKAKKKYDKAVGELPSQLDCPFKYCIEALRLLFDEDVYLKVQDVSHLC